MQGLDYNRSYGEGSTKKSEDAPPCITRSIITTFSGHDSLRTVRRLCLHGMGIKSIDALTTEECSMPQLTALDLSSNELTEWNLAPLAALAPRLARLELAENAISSLKPLLQEIQWPKLESLELQGNRIGDLEELKLVKKLPSLLSIRFQGQAGQSSLGGSNPVCRANVYRETIVGACPPSVTCIDGQAFLREGLDPNATLRLTDGAVSIEIPASFPGGSPPPLCEPGREGVMDSLVPAEFRERILEAQRSAAQHPWQSRKGKAGHLGHRHSPILAPPVSGSIEPFHPLSHGYTPSPQASTSPAVPHAAPTFPHLNSHTGPPPPPGGTPPPASSTGPQSSSAPAGQHGPMYPVQ